MKHALVFALLALAVCAGAFECTPFGPAADIIYTANFDQYPISVGGSNDQNFSCLYIDPGMGWESYPYTCLNFPITGIYKLDDATYMVSMGNGSYSDGIYNFDLDTHEWEINEWFYWPNFILYYPDGGMYYVGDHSGLHRSADASEWTQVNIAGMDECNSFAWHGNHVVINLGNGVYYSDDAGQNWQLSMMTLLEGFRFTSGGTLYGLMDAGSDSDGLWRSDDFGATWDVVFWTDHLSCIGPDFAGYLPLGWDQQNYEGNFLELLHPDGTRVPLSHVDLDSPVVELEIFPLINTPSFYVINSNGLYYLTGFLPVENGDEAMPPASSLNFSLYPNPARGRLDLEFSGKVPDEAEVTLYDLKGRKLAPARMINPREGRIAHELPDLPAGIYLLKVETREHAEIKKVTVLR
ncbi:MAG: T9SS type A sorting domain-containing protein [Candidatus Syntrophosphaera sp.]